MSYVVLPLDGQCLVECSVGEQWTIAEVQCEKTNF